MTYGPDILPVKSEAHEVGVLKSHGVWTCSDGGQPEEEEAHFYDKRRERQEVPTALRCALQHVTLKAGPWCSAWPSRPPGSRPGRAASTPGAASCVCEHLHWPRFNACVGEQDASKGNCFFALHHFGL